VLIQKKQIGNKLEASKATHTKKTEWFQIFSLTQEESGLKLQAMLCARVPAHTRISLFLQLTNVTNDVIATTEGHNKNRSFKNRTFKGHILSHFLKLRRPYQISGTSY